MTLQGWAPVAMETCGSWMWITRELEKAGLAPRPADPSQGKKMTSGSTRTDATDAAILTTLLGSGILPEVGMAPPAIRDLRGSVWTRLSPRQHQSALKNRIHCTLNQYVPLIID